MKLEDFLYTLLNAEEFTIKVNGKELDQANADSEIIMWEVHHKVIDIWTCKPKGAE